MKRKRGKRLCGIYVITNEINSKQYVGQSINIKSRWTQHKCKSTWEKKSVLYDAFRKYGIENFKFDILELCNKEELDQKEIEWVSKLNTYHNGYNLTTGGASKYVTEPIKWWKKKDKDCGWIYDEKYFSNKQDVLDHINEQITSLWLDEVEEEKKLLKIKKSISEKDEYSYLYIEKYNKNYDRHKKLRYETKTKQLIQEFVDKSTDVMQDVDDYLGLEDECRKMCEDYGVDFLEECWKENYRNYLFEKELGYWEDED